MARDANVAQYERHREDVRKRLAADSAAARDIGNIPSIIDPARRQRGEAALQNFIEAYLIGMFTVRGVHWPWSATHLKVMQRIEVAVRDGQLSAIAMPRGGAKTSLAKAGALWALLYGYCRWACIIAATAKKAERIIADVQTIIETNPLLAEDFPEVCYPVARLERIVNRQRGQVCNGVPTRMTWNAGEIVLPDIPGSRSAQGIFTAIGLDGAGIRGQVRVLADGTQIRPEFVLLDDPQTDESAKSEFQTADRLELLSGAVLEMGPPGVPLAGVATVTVIRDGDAADKLLELPEWHGIRSPMLIKFPLHMAATPEDIPHKDWWDQYSRLLSDGRIEDATELYKNHRCLPECDDKLDQPRPCAGCSIRDTCMDAEAIVSWQHRKYPADLSAVQHAMNRHIKNPAMFAAEMQQSPLSAKQSGVRITPAQVAQRVTGMKREHVPTDATVLTAGVDVHDEILYWIVCAWTPDFSGQIIQYGTFPEQPSRWFRQANPPKKLSSEFVGQNKDGVIAAALERLIGVMLKHEFVKHAGGATTIMSIKSLLCDSGYKPTIVYNVRRKLASPVMQASRGLPLRASNKPITSYQRKPGWQIGENWYVPSVRGTREFPHVCIDTNAWKTYVHRALAVSPTAAGAITLYGAAGTNEHEQIAEHLASSEFYTEVFANGRMVCEYKPMPGRPDNHWFDCLVMATVAASMNGCKAAAEVPTSLPTKRRRFRSLQELGV